jgi:ABC-type sugar transport system ATPase subunit
MEALDVHGVSKSYGDSVKALSDVSFALQAGQFGVLLGPSGAGKSTLLNIIAGLTRADQGHVTIGGRDMSDVDPEFRDVAMVFENYALYPHMTVRKNLEFPLRAPVRAGQMTNAQIAERVQEVTDIMHMGHLLDRLPSQLSGGQRQRVSLGRALVRRPRLLLLDEPITHLDAKLRHEMRTELKRIQKDLGTTTLYATPDQADALALGDLVIVLQGGHIWQVAPPEDAYRAPAHLRVAESLGDPRMNLLPDRMAAGGVEVLGVDLRLPSERSAGVARQGDVLVGVRPQDLSLCQGSEPDAARGTVILRQTLGVTDLLIVDVQGVVVRLVGDGLRDLGTGDDVWLRPNPDRLHLFDPETGAAITKETAPCPV